MCLFDIWLWGFRGQGTFKKLSKVPIPFGRARLPAWGHGEGKGLANGGEGDSVNWETAGRREERGQS